jgi:hypothetical protein
MTRNKGLESKTRAFVDRLISLFYLVMVLIEKGGGGKRGGEMKDGK